jgi:predicted CXXCH cytochrome family protein
VEDAGLVTAHLGAPLAELICTRCHTPHGEGHPKLLARTLHPPVLDGCDVCHEGAFDQLVEEGGPDLCLLCHGDVGESTQEAPVPHAALELAGCSDCHDPHASAQSHLVKLPDGRECFDCHGDSFPDDDEVAHGVIGLIGCRACHEPHGGSRPMLLRRSGAELCLSCHDPRAVAAEEGAATVRLLDRFQVPAAALPAMVTLRLSRDGSRGHPVAGHRVLGTPTAEELERTETTFTGELTCLTCHDPHKGRSRSLFRWNAASSLEACQACHPK